MLRHRDAQLQVVTDSYEIYMRNFKRRLTVKYYAYLLKAGESLRKRKCCFLANQNNQLAW